MQNLGIIIKRFCADNGTEFKKVKKYCEDNGIIWQDTQAYAPDMNGASERVGKDLMAKTLALLHNAGLLKSL